MDPPIYPFEGTSFMNGPLVKLPKFRGCQAPMALVLTQTLYYKYFEGERFKNGLKADQF